MKVTKNEPFYPCTISLQTKDDVVFMLLVMEAIGKPRSIVPATEIIDGLRGLYPWLSRGSAK